MSPDVAAAVEGLHRDGLLSAEAARPLRRLALGHLVSVHAEIRVLSYLGVLVTVAGAGVLLRDNLARLGPLAIAFGVGAAAVSCLAYVARQAPAFSWGEVESPGVAFDYLLLLGALLAAADLAYVEAQFTPLGAGWPLHFLVVAAFYALLALRYDSRTLFSMALGSFAAWRGVSITLHASLLFGHTPAVLRWNALACGAAFALLGQALLRKGKKAHFEPVAVHIGALLVLGALASGMGLRSFEELGFALGLLGAGAALAAASYRGRRFGLFVLGVIAAYASACGLFFRLDPGAEASLLFMAVTALGLVFALVALRRHFKEDAE
jgi:hypothetical protein